MKKPNETNLEGTENFKKRFDRNGTKKVEKHKYRPISDVIMR